VSIAYVDSSALLKLVVSEAETSALEADLATRDGLVSSGLAVVECHRAALRSGNRRILQRAERVFEAVYLLDLTRPLLERASTLRPLTMRSLDAIHVASALSIDEADMEVITYDERMAEAARANGLRVSQPGRTARRT
jgi:predicted nucleic acid-binding protein